MYCTKIMGPFNPLDRISEGVIGAIIQPELLFCTAVRFIYFGFSGLLIYIFLKCLLNDPESLFSTVSDLCIVVTWRLP